MSGTDPTHHSERVNGVRLHYVRAGSGAPVVLLHGWPETWYQWRKVIPQLAERYTVIAPDLRGLGDSSRPATGYDKRTIAEDVRQLVERLGFERIFLVGHDWGGPVAYALACAQPARVRRLVILDVAITIDEAEVAAQFAKRFHLSFHAQTDLATALVAGRERTYLEWFYRSAYDPSVFRPEDVDEYVRCYSAPGAMRAGFEYYRAIWTDLEHQRENAKTPLEMPVLALGGSASFGEHTAASCRRIAKDVRGGVIDRCGHWIAEEQPERLCEALLDFFAEEPITAG